MRASWSPEESDLAAWLDRHTDDLVGFARELVATPSVNPPGDERAVVRLIVDRLVRLGVSDVAIRAKEEHRPNLIARLVGDPAGPTLILSGHMDTKPPGEMGLWRTEPWDPVIEDGQLVGLGSADMKGAIAAIVYAIAALASRPGVRAGSLQLVFTADEEAGSVLGSRWLAETRQFAGDAAIIGEPSGISRDWEGIHVVSRGAALFKIRVRGTQMHSSVSDRFPAVNASVKMAELILRMERDLRARLTYTPHPLASRGPTVNIGVMAHAGVYYGVYPGSAEFACDIRTLPGMSERQLMADVEGVLAEARREDPELDAELVLERWVDATEIDPNSPAVSALREAASRVLGAAPPVMVFPGATDAAHIQGTAGIPTVAAFGPGLLPTAHSPNESVSIEGIKAAALIYALAFERFAKSGTPMATLRAAKSP